MPVTSKCEEYWRSLLAEGTPEEAGKEVNKTMCEDCKCKNGAESESEGVKLTPGVGEVSLGGIFKVSELSSTLWTLLGNEKYYHIDINAVVVEDFEI